MPSTVHYVQKYKTSFTDKLELFDYSYSVSEGAWRFVCIGKHKDKFVVVTGWCDDGIEEYTAAAMVDLDRGVTRKFDIESDRFEMFRDLIIVECKSLNGAPQRCYKDYRRD